MLLCVLENSVYIIATIKSVGTFAVFSKISSEVNVSVK